MNTSNTDTARLDWVLAHKATIDRRCKMKTRRGGLAESNLEPVYVVNWYQPNGDNIEQTPDCDYKTTREAIDGAMGLTPNEKLMDGSVN